jgi:GntR family transcriptional regulator, transcriptional repressor for pyruvate dehydrogenase complex
METAYHPIKRQKNLSSQVADQLQQLIVEGQIKPGERLPTERELGQTFQVSRTVIREAIRAMEARGLVESKTGSGTYVRAINGEDVSNSLGMYISTHQGQVFSLESLMEVRRVLEIQMAALAAQRASEQDIRSLEATLDHMCQSRGEASAFSRWDLNFHLQLAQASGNPLFGILIEPLTEAFLQLIWTGSTSPGAAEEACDFHRAILEKVKAKDAQGAAESMRAHLDQSQRVTEQGIKRRESE